MPELPEVETIKRTLALRLVGLKIKSYSLFFPPLLRNTDGSLLEKLIGNRVDSVNRRGKTIAIHIAPDWRLLFHLKMTGQFLFCPEDLPIDKHTHFRLGFFSYPQELRFRDIRKFGYMYCCRSSELAMLPFMKSLGAEPMEISFSSFERLFVQRKARLKNLLLNQNFLAGIGNIYADEILFRAGLFPNRAVSSLKPKQRKVLWQTIRKVLQEAIRHRGTSIRNYVDAEGRAGDYRQYHRVYGRESEPCFTCGGKIERMRLSGRSTHFCPQCQK